MNEKASRSSLIRVVLADDHQIVREGLRAMIGQEKDMEVVADAENGRVLLQVIGKASPDVVVVDISMPDLNGIEAARQIHADSPHTKIVALSMHSDKNIVAGMLNAGARGYVLKECAFDEIAHAIRTVASDRTYLSPGIADIVVDDYVHRLAADSGSAFSVLTAREREVLQLMAEGHSTRQIATRLHISVKTVETHRRQIMDKLDIHTIPQLTKYAVREGLSSLEE